MSTVSDDRVDYRELLSINRLITSSLDPVIVLAAVTRHATELLRAQAAALFLAERDELHLVATFGLPARLGLTLQIGPGVMQHVAGLAKGWGLGECAGAPLVLRGATIGLLVIYRQRGAAPTAHAEELLGALADQAAIAIDNAHHYRESQAYARSLAETEERFRLAFEEAPIGMGLVGLDGRFLRVNRALGEITGYPPEELTQRTSRSITHPDDVDADLQLTERLARGEIPSYRIDKRYVRKDHATVDVTLSGSIVRRRDGSPEYFIAQIEDVTEQRRAEAALRRSEAQFRELVAGLPDGVFIERDGRVVYANRALATMLGYDDSAAMIGTSVDDLFAPRARALVTPRLRQAAAMDTATPPLELEMLTRDGRAREVETAELRVQFEGRPAVVVLVRDLSERRRAERERKEALTRLQSILEIAPIGIIITDASTWRANRRALELMGHPADVPLTAETYRGTLLDRESRPVPIDSFPGRRALTGEQVAGYEATVVRSDGSRVPIRANATPIRDDAGAVIAAVTTLEDVSAFKELERMRAEWSSLVAHDLRQPLTSISVYARIVAQQTADNPALSRRAGQMMDAAQRLSRMVQDLLDYTRLEARQLQLHRTSFDLAPLVDETADRLAHDPAQPRIDVHIAERPIAVDADRDRVIQILENLLTNAIKYGAPHRPISVDVALPSDAEIAVSVTNEGPGIDAAFLPRLFERFQRANAGREHVKGIGLGLYITRELVEAHGGRIGVESTPGATTTFRFTLPRAKA
jgi:PAS domain S-box-containing protein